MKLSYKIFLYFGTFTLFIILIFFTANYYVIQPSLHKRARNDLVRMVESTSSAVENMLEMAIHNYLRGVVEQDVAMLGHLEGMVRLGRITRQEAEDLFQSHVDKKKIGQSGYIVALKRDGPRIILAIHPFLRNQDCASNKGCRDWMSLKEGYSEYAWQNPEDRQVRKKVSYLKYFEPWNWVVGSTSYEDELTQLVKIDDLRPFIHSLSILEQGYFIVVDENVNMLIHPELEGVSGHDLQDVDGVSIVQEMVKTPGTFFYYRWKNPSESKVREKFAYAKKIENFNWYLVATGYMEDVNQPINRLTRISYTLVVIVAILLTILVGFFSHSLSRPLADLVQGLKAFYQERKVFKMASRSVTEIEAVGQYVENMTLSLVAAEREKKELLDLLDSSINSMPSILTCVDGEEQIMLWNDKAAEYSGISREEALDHRFSDLFPEFGQILAQMKKKIKDQAYFKDTCIIQDKKGLDHHFSLTLYPLHSVHRSAVIRIDDITEQVHMEEVLLQSHKMESIGTLAGGIAHDFNNILSAILGYTEICKMGVSEGDVVSGHLEKIFTAGQRAKGLVQQILTFSRQSRQELRPLSVALIAGEALKLIKATLPSSIEIRDEIDCSSQVMGDPTQMHQILMNLCSNAGHAMRETGGILSVAFSDLPYNSEFVRRYPELEKAPHVHLMVSDTGCGMTQDVADRMFDPFFTTKEQGEGTGMGLAVVHGIVKDLGGTIDIKSRPGEGTLFNIFLPAVHEGEKKVKSLNNEIPGGFERILFVDDEPELAEIGRTVLAGLGYRVTARTNPEEALGLFREDPDEFDLVITDMTMPKMSGENLAREILAIRKEIPILLCTGFSSGMTDEKVRQAGIEGFLMKPVVRADLARNVRRLLDQVD